MDIDMGIVPPNECNISTGNTHQKKYLSIYILRFVMISETNYPILNLFWSDTCLQTSSDFL